ncbi:unnamed protein product [Moneuplotes crassus]|uniref:Major facilitator superfamily (MFS) profile domain-containing protein n=1 Tax=Euplotes crassus TaxID=5936 RepID=A0AAD1U9U9_EUPCR|nr:unnamed protein product [Moneuplotes crassus]
MEQKYENRESENILGDDSMKSDFNPSPNRIFTFNGKDGNSEAARRPGATLEREMVKVRGNNLFIIVVSSIMISFSFAELMVFASPFLELIPPMQCLIENKWETCEKEQACAPGAQYVLVEDDKYSLKNWVTDLDLVCSPEWKIGLIGSAIFVGMFLGALVLSPISDTYGRRPVHIIGVLLSIIGSVWIYTFPNWVSVLTSLFFKGIGMYTRLSISYLYTLEMFDEERCKLVASVIMSVNNALSSVMALYFIFGGRDATFFLLSSIFILGYSLVFIPMLPESPKFLFSLRKYDATRATLIRIAKMNGVKYEKLPFQEELDQKGLAALKAEAHLQTIEKEKKEKTSFLELFKNFKLFTNMCITIFVFMFNVFSMYMISFMVKYLPGDKYWNLFLIGLADFIPSVLSGVVMALLPTKKAMILTHGFICISIGISFITNYYDNGGIVDENSTIEGFDIGTFISNNNAYISMGVIFLIRFAITLESCLNFYIVYELFPSKFASVVYGGCNILAGLVSIFSPMAVEIFDNPLILVFVMACICTFLCTILTEGTKNIV